MVVEGAEITITLTDINRRDRHFVLETPSGKWTVVRGELEHRTWGFATLVRQRCGLRDPVFIAIFTDRKDILLRINDDLFNLGDPHIQIKHRWAGILTKRFIVLSEGRELASVTYGYLSVDRDAFDEECIFDYLAEMFRDKSQIGRTVFVWTAAGEGRELGTPEFVAELEARFPTTKK